MRVQVVAVSGCTIKSAKSLHCMCGLGSARFAKGQFAMLGQGLWVQIIPVIQIFKTSPPLICPHQYPQCIRSCMGTSNIGGGSVLYIYIYMSVHICMCSCLMYIYIYTYT